MSKLFFAIEKETSFQGRTERWANVYCYDTPASTDTAYDAIIDGLVAAEKPVHAPSVSFKQARVYTTNGLNVPLAPGTMYRVRDLTGVGTGVEYSSSVVYKECAVRIKWPLPRKSGLLGGVGPPRALAKWIHPCGSVLLSTATAQGISKMQPTEVNHYAAYAAAVSEAVDGSPLVSPSDGTPNSAAPVVGPYLEHRQFPKGRKET